MTVLDSEITPPTPEVSTDHAWLPVKRTLHREPDLSISMRACHGVHGADPSIHGT